MSLSVQNNMNTEQTKAIKNKKAKLTIFEMVLFSMFASMMFISKIVMEFLPNIHLLGMFVMLLTVVYRKKALIPIYLFVLLQGIYGGFAVWWVPYLYVWTVLWAVTMLLPQNMNKKVCMIVYPLVCCLHGLCFGILYAPIQAMVFGFTFKQTVAWVAAGFPFDITHAVGNLVLGTLVYPLSILIVRLSKKINK